MKRPSVVGTVRHCRRFNLPTIDRLHGALWNTTLACTMCRRMKDLFSSSQVLASKVTNPYQALLRHPALINAKVIVWRSHDCRMVIMSCLRTGMANGVAIDCKYTLSKGNKRIEWALLANSWYSWYTLISKLYELCTVRLCRRLSHLPSR